jgi:class 3 adenylate cyclase
MAFARALIAGLAEVREATGLDVHLRIGIHSGPVVGGVIGETRMAYDYWGETMNIASRIEGVADRDGVAVSEATYLRSKGEYEFAPSETILLKGVGEMPVYKMIAA